ncbi:MAG: undecaprenyl-phosphate glucose phosphotransferase [Bacteroidota bacterium]|nr:undecaprenyl-phosphate glucose phosphotransferase [Bacteroidota bacterium]
MKTNESGLKFLYLAVDLIILNIAIAVIFLITPFIKELNYHDISLYILHANFSWVITYSFYSIRNLYIHDYFLNRVKRISKRIVMFVMVSYVLAQLFLPRTFSRFFLLEYTALFYVGKLIVYYIVYRYLRYIRAKGFYIHRVLVLGSNDMSIFLRNLMSSNPMLGYKFIGYIADKPELNRKDVMGQLEELAPLVEKHQIDILFVTDSAYSDSTRTKELLATCNKLGVRLRFVPENQYWFKFRKNLESVGSLVVVNPQEIPLDDLNSRFIKRIFDIFFSSMVILFIISWLFPIICILIKLSSKGPVFFRQERTGINNKSFTCLKFRSMCLNKDADTRQATQGDSRITAMGRFLRKSNLDEFPQFFNVLVGQMSIVGPRPHMLKHTDQYSELIEYYRVRHYVKPGITGWAQVNGYRGLTDELWKMEKRVEYDMIYLENWTLWLDIKIIFLTIFGKRTRMNAG